MLVIAFFELFIGRGNTSGLFRGVNIVFTYPALCRLSADLSVRFVGGGVDSFRTLARWRSLMCFPSSTRKGEVNLTLQMCEIVSLSIYIRHPPEVLPLIERSVRRRQPSSR